MSLGDMDSSSSELVYYKKWLPPQFLCKTPILCKPPHLYAMWCMLKESLVVENNREFPTMCLIITSWFCLIKLQNWDDGGTLTLQLLTQGW